VSVPAPLRGALMVCGTTSDAGKSFVVAGLCRLLARRGVRVAPFKAQNMALNAAVTADGAEIGHAQWVQAVAAGVEPEAAMNPVLLKPTGERSSQVIVMGRATGVQSAAEYHRAKQALFPVVLDALADLRRRFDVVICEGAGSPAEINLLDGDIVNLPLARAAGVPAIVVGDIDRGGVFASLYGTVAVLPDDLRATVRAFVINKLRGDPALLGDACADLERRCGVPTLGVLPHIGVADIDNEDSLALDRAMSDSASGQDEPPGPKRSRAGRAADGRATDLLDGVGGGRAPDVLDVAALRWPRVSNAGDLDPLHLEPSVRVRWVRSVAELGRPDLVVLPGSKDTRGDLAWFRATGLAGAVARVAAPVVAVCAGLQMVGLHIDDPDGVEGPPGGDDGLAWLDVTTDFRGDKVLDRPAGTAVAGPGAARPVHGYRIHHGRVSAGADPPPGPASSAHRAASAPRHGAGLRPRPDAGDSAPPFVPGSEPTTPWLIGDADGGEVLGWRRGRVLGTTVHGLFESDGFRADLLRWVAGQAGKDWAPGGIDFGAQRLTRLDAMADAIERHLDVDRLLALVAEAAT
jgi:adenosylcobyric acid synthase